MQEHRADEHSVPEFRVLMVDDNEGDLLLYRASLEVCAKATFHTDEVASGRAGAEILKTTKFDCVMLDYQLPDCVGTELVNDYREAAGDPDLPVILLTGFSDEDMAIEAMRSDVSDYLPKKHISPQSLYRAIDNAVTKAAYSRASRTHLAKIESMNAELVAKNQEIQAFYQSVSHELKTPLTAIREYTSLVLDGIAGDIPDKATDFLSTSLECTDRLTRLVNDLFDTVRIESGKLSLQKREGSVSDVAQQALRLLKEAGEQAQVCCSVEVETHVPDFTFDPDRILQVLINLLSNAMKFTPAGGSIVVLVGFEQAEERVTINVRDTGRGIADGDLLRIFDRLYQSCEGDAINHSGLGIGLHLCKTIVEIHGGEIWVTSELDKGSDFQFYLPVQAA